MGCTLVYFSCESTCVSSESNLGRCEGLVGFGDIFDPVTIATFNHFALFETCSAVTMFCYADGVVGLGIFEIVFHNAWGVSGARREPRPLLILGDNTLNRCTVKDVVSLGRHPTIHIKQTEDVEETVVEVRNGSVAMVLGILGEEVQKFVGECCVGVEEVLEFSVEGVSKESAHKASVKTETLLELVTDDNTEEFVGAVLGVGFVCDDNHLVIYDTGV